MYIYFDNAAATKPCKEAVEALNAALTDNFKNPSSLHGGGVKAEKAIGAAREVILSELGLKGEFIFTSGATESNNLALFGAAEAYKRRGTRIIIAANSHPSVAHPANRLAERGFEVVLLSPKNCEQRADFFNVFENYILSQADENTVLISVPAVCSETGYITDTAYIYREIKKERLDCIIHVDGVQAFGRGVRDIIDGDLISVSAHKIGGVKGVGGLFVKNGARIVPQIYGGGQQKGLRAGTEPTALICAFAAAVKAKPLDQKRFIELYERLTKGLEKLPDVKLNIPNGVPYIVSFSVRGVKSEIMLHFLEERGIYVSSGSACGRGKRSEILLSYGISESDADSAIRVSFCGSNTDEEVDRLLEALEAGIKRFRR